MGAGGDVLPFGGHVAVLVLADVLPVLTNHFVVDDEAGEGVMGGGGRGDGSCQEGKRCALHLD